MEPRVRGVKFPQTRDIAEEQVLALLEARRHRAEIFGESLFFDPAWGILLQLFAAELGDRKMSLDDLAPIAPKSVLARWVGALEDKQLVVCDAGTLQSSEFWIRLSPECSAKMHSFLSFARYRAGFG